MTTQYLYDINPATFADLPYREALQLKKQAAHNLVGKLLDVPLAQRDEERFMAAYKAVKFNQDLLDEIITQ